MTWHITFALLALLLSHLTKESTGLSARIASTLLGALAGAAFFGAAQEFPL